MLDKQGDTHAHAEICNTYCFSSATMIRERASALRYTYIVSFVLFVSAHVISLSLSFVFFLFRLFCRLHLCLFCVRLVPYRCLHSPVRSSVCPVTCLSLSLSLSVTHQVFSFHLDACLCIELFLFTLSLLPLWCRVGLRLLVRISSAF
jgi:hypothetical protein